MVLGIQVPLTLLLSHPQHVASILWSEIPAKEEGKETDWEDSLCGKVTTLRLLIAHPLSCSLTRLRLGYAYLGGRLEKSIFS